MRLHGIQVPAALLNFLIEAAVQAMKALKAHVDAPAAPEPAEKGDTE